MSACNDNSYSRRLFYNKADENGHLTRLLCYIPVARNLIKRHSKKPYKHSVENSDYAFLEYQLCTVLDRQTASPIQRTFQIIDMASVLEINPTMLTNDPSLSGNPIDLARFP